MAKFRYVTELNDVNAQGEIKQTNAPSFKYVTDLNSTSVAPEKALPNKSPAVPKSTQGNLGANSRFLNDASVTPALPKAPSDRLPFVPNTTLMPYSPTFLDKLRNINFKDALLSGLDTSVFAGALLRFADKAAYASYENAQEKGRLPYGIPEKPKKYVPQNNVEKAMALGGSFLGDAPLMPLNIGSSFLKAKTALNPIVREGITQGITGGVIGTAQGIINEESASDVAKRAGAGLVLGGMLGSAVTGIPMGVKTLADNRLTKQAEKLIPEIKPEPLKDVQNAYKAPALRDVRQAELGKVFTNTPIAERTGATPNSAADYLGNTATQADFENLFGSPIKKYSFRSKRQQMNEQMYSDLFNGRPVPESPAEYFGKITKDDLEKVWGKSLSRYSIKPRKQVEYENLFSGDDVFFSPKRETAKGNRPDKPIAQAEFEELFGGPITRHSFIKKQNPKNVVPAPKNPAEYFGNITKEDLEAVWGRPTPERTDDYFGNITKNDTIRAFGELDLNNIPSLKPRKNAPNSSSRVLTTKEVPPFIRKVDVANVKLQPRDLSRTREGKPYPWQLRPREISATSVGNVNLRKTVQPGQEFIPRTSEGLRVPERKTWTNRENIPFAQNPPIKSITPENIDQLLGGNAARNMKMESLPNQDVSLRQMGANVEASSAKLVGDSTTQGIIVPKQNTQAKNFSEPTIAEGFKERGVSENIRTDETRPDELRQAFVSNPLEYIESKNKDSLSRAYDILRNNSLEDSITKANELVEKLSPEAPPLIKLISDELTKAGQVDRAYDFISTAAAKATAAGQYNQAWIMLRSADPATMIKTVSKMFKTLNREGQEEYGKKWKDVSLTPNELDAVGRIEPGNQRAFEDTLAQIQKRVADEMPSTAMEKINAWRHTSMLLNIKTNLRNIGGNAILFAMRQSSQRVSGVLQKVLLPESKRTQSILVKSEYEKLAKDYFDSNSKDIISSANKYQENIKLNMPDKRVFRKSRIAEKLGIENKILSDLPEQARKLTYKLLEMGDLPFFKKAYVDRLASYAQVKGIKDFSDLPAESFEIAQREAEDATFRTATRLASFLNRVKNPGANAGAGSKLIGIGVEAVVPFTRTPINIIKQGIKYSPVGILEGLYKGARSPNEAPRAIDDLAKGLTGTGIMGLGFLLAESGIITGAASTDKDQRAYNKASGNHPFSVLGRYSYDWALPFSVPLAVGVSIYNSLKDNQRDLEKMGSAVMNNDTHVLDQIAVNSANAMVDALSASGDVVFNMSIMKGLQNLLGSGFGGFTEGLADLPQQYASQFIPTVSGQLAGTIDPTIRQRHISGNRPETFKNTLLSKIPFASKTLQPLQTPFGQDMQRPQDIGTRAFSQFISPGVITIDQGANPKVDAEIRRLADLGYKRQIPALVPNYIEGTKRYPKLDLTPAETTQYQRRAGRLTLSEFQKVMKSGEYITAKTEGEREKLLADAVSRSKAQAKAEIAKSRGL